MLKRLIQRAAHSPFSKLMRCRSQSPVKCSNLDYLTILTPPKRIYPKGDSHTKNTMTEYEKVKDFLEWADREVPKEVAINLVKKVNV